MEAQSESTLHLKSEMLENLSLHLDDVEFLQNAFLVQAALGPLIRFSNRGRYEPYVAKSWTQNGNSWTFHLHKGLSCEDGEIISAESFRKSLLGSLSRFSAEDIKETPFRHLSGISAHEDDLTLNFSENVGKALLEYLAMSPFAYLCAANFEGKEWKSREHFVSSGPYRIAKFDPKANLCVLELRKKWPLNPGHAFQRVYLSKDDLPGVKVTSQVEMTYGKPKATGQNNSLVLEVPRALMSARTGIGEGQFLSDQKNRRALQAAVNKVLDSTEVPFENYHRAESFFFGQVSGHEMTIAPPDWVEPPKTPLKVRAIAKGLRPEVDFYQGILFKALENLGWSYEIMAKPIGSTKDFFNLSYDIAFDRSHVDATLDPDFVRLLFKSKLGPRYQDPGHRVASLVDKYDKGSMPYRDFLISFNSIIAEEAAILPLYHRGFSWQFSPNVNVQNISPLMSILRYEELDIRANGKN